MKLILASNNKGKLREVRGILPDMEIISQSEAGVFLDVEETGDSFEENACLKAEAVTRLTGLPAVADDSGLCVDALGGAPGVHSARYTGSHADTDTDRCALLLKNMADKTERGAKFVCCVCCTFPNGDILRARGECEGDILPAPRGENGFGYDPVFQPAGCGGRSMAELSDDEKNAISHRGRAMREFKRALDAYLCERGAK